MAQENRQSHHTELHPKGWSTEAVQRAAAPESLRISVSGTSTTIAWHV